MRTLAVLLIGIALGVILTFGSVELAGGWYTYDTIPADQCRTMPPAGEVVPNQPNPCHVRYRRWRLLH